MAYFSHFNNAIADLGKVKSITPYSGFGTLKMLDTVRSNLVESEKFYLPNDINILSGKRYVSTVMESLRLPFERTSILHRVKGYLTIIVAEQLNATELNYFCMVQGRHEWFIIPQLIRYRKPIGYFGFDITITEFKEDGSQFNVTDPAVFESCEGVIGTMTHLCIMLSLHNVKTAEVRAPKLLKRIHKKKNFYDYHVLNVNGDVWDRPVEEDQEKNPHYFRSHMRRGHIRKLPNGFNTWVSACFVRGNVEGYVGKEYRIAG
jgi:hypothetical protein